MLSASKVNFDLLLKLLAKGRSRLLKMYAQMKG